MGPHQRKGLACINTSATRKREAFSECQNDYIWAYYYWSLFQNAWGKEHDLNPLIIWILPTWGMHHASYKFKAAFVCFLVALVQFFSWDVAEERSFQPSRFCTIQDLCSFVLWAQTWINVQVWAESSPTLALSQAAVLTAVFTRWPFILLPLLKG